jgi:hypothetical protein
MINQQMPNRLRFGESDIHGNAPAAILVEPEPSPTEHTPARRAEMDLE